MAEETPKTPGVEGQAPFMEHLKELRNRILYSAIAVALGLVVGMIFGNYILYLLKLPAGNIELVALTLVENVSAYFKVSLTAGVIIAMPVLVYQLFAFVAPGLTPREKRLVFSILPAIIFMFLGGVAFAYFIALSPAIGFLYNFNRDIATPMVSISNYIGFVTRIILIIGLVFETPLIVMLLAKMGVVSPQWMAARRKWWILISFIVAAVATPTPDPVNMLIVAIPLVLLLELGVLLARLVYKKKREQTEETAA
jgi:sec-independent protein translocase protein TatC